MTNTRTYEPMTANRFTPEGMAVCTELLPNGSKNHFYVVRREGVDLVESRSQGDLYAKLDAYEATLA